ncbi:Tetratricopeptide-like helical domain superfamily [Sesbania bispinosa]|nr:Tetratricopeptide-like helical domain superfamily [Sesbania bispinosa]
MTKCISPAVSLVNILPTTAPIDDSLLRKEAHDFSVGTGSVVVPVLTTDSFVWINVCKFTTNASLGPALENVAGVFSDTGCDGYNIKTGPGYSTELMKFDMSGSVDAIKHEEFMEDNNYPPDSVTYNELVAAYIRDGYHDEGVVVIDTMTSKGIMPNVITYTTVINAYAKTGKRDKALKLFNQMKELGCVTDRLGPGKMELGLGIHGEPGAAVMLAELAIEAVFGVLSWFQVDRGNFGGKVENPPLSCRRSVLGLEEELTLKKEKSFSSSIFGMVELDLRQLVAWSGAATGSGCEIGGGGRDGDQRWKMPMVRYLQKMWWFGVAAIGEK